MGEYVKLERQSRIATLRLNKPDSLNAIGTIEDCDDLVRALDDIGADRSVSVVVVTGNGRAFCAGGNIQAIKNRNGIGPLDQPDSTRANYRRGVQRVTRAFMDLEVPAIAAINGPAIGLGLDLACLCDIRIAADTATMAASFIKLGIVPGDGGAWSLSRITGYAKAAELFFTGRSFGAAEAQAMGLLADVVAPEDLMPRALGLAEVIAAHPARALRLTKRLLRDAQNLRMSDVLELSAAFQAIIHETGDHREAVDAMIAKRAPVFTGN